MYLSILQSLCSDVIHKFVKDKYSKRFPELESLVHSSMEYIRTVKVRVLMNKDALGYLNHDALGYLNHGPCVVL